MEASAAIPVVVDVPAMEVSCKLRVMRPAGKTWAESDALVQVRAFTNCSKAAKLFAFECDMVDADVDGNADAEVDGDDGDEASAWKANVPCCNSPKREWGIHESYVNKGLYIYT